MISIAGRSTRRWPIVGVGVGLGLLPLAAAVAGPDPNAAVGLEVVVTAAASVLLIGVRIGLSHSGGTGPTIHARSSLEGAADGIAILTTEGEYLQVNRAYASLYGYDDPSAFPGESWRLGHPPETIDRFEDEVLPAVRETGAWRGELAAERRDGSTFIQAASFGLTDAGDVVCIARDITERKERERALESIEGRFRALTDNAPFGVITIDEASTVRYANGTVEDIFGYEADELVGESLSALIPERLRDAHYDGLVRYIESGERQLDWGSIELTGLHRDGHEIPIGISFGETVVDGTHLFTGVVRDITERKERDQQLARQADQLEFFNSILRHDVLNGMTVIRSRAETLTEETDGEPAEQAETIVKWCDEIVEIVQRVRRVLDTLTADEEQVLEPVDLSGLLEAEVDRMRSTFPGVEFETDIPPGVTVEADDLLSEVFGNVVANAVEHNERAGLRVAVSAVTVGERAVVRIADNGRGVPDDRKEAIFRRGETGHAKTTGSGFGLFFVDAMITKYGGRVGVEDNDAGGATFVIELVRATERQE